MLYKKEFHSKKTAKYFKNTEEAAFHTSDFFSCFLFEGNCFECILIALRNNNNYKLISSKNNVLIILPNMFFRAMLCRKGKN